MRIGSIGYATERGLGHLMHDFFLNGVITDVVTVLHGRVPDKSAEWYPSAPVLSSLRDSDQLEVARAFCRAMDAMLFFETPFIWPLIPFCRQHGVRTFLVTMYECTPITHEPPDVYLCPSKLDWQYFGDGACPPPFVTMGGARGKQAALVALPVAIPWQQKTVARHFVHNGGYLGLRGREGTTLLIEAMRHVKSDLRLTIRVQEDVGPEHRMIALHDPRVRYIKGSFPREQLYAEGDVAVLPQKFNGCSMPMQEARASGMAVLTTDRFPTNDWLDGEGFLIPVAGTQRAQIGGAYLEFDEAVIEPKAIAESMDALFSKDISWKSRLGKEWADRNSWAALKPKWMEVLSV